MIRVSGNSVCLVPPKLKLFRAFVVLAEIHWADFAFGPDTVILSSADYADTTMFENDYELVARTGMQYVCHGWGDHARE